MENILVFYGGTSPERDVSVITGVFTLNSFDKTKFKAIPVYIHSDGVFYTGDELKNLNFYKQRELKKCYRVVLLPGSRKLYRLTKNKLKELCEVDCAINCLHGTGGEDGTLAGILKNCRIPLASPDLFASAMSIDKHYTKLALKAIGVNQVEYVKIKRDGFFAHSEGSCRVIGNRLGYPIIVKPANLGSSIGIKRVNDEKELFSALCEAFNYDCKAICEKYIENATELNCAAYSADGTIVVSELEQPYTEHDILTFDDKYSGSKSGETRKNFPADVDPALRDKVRAIASKIYSEFDFFGLVRFDFLIDGNIVYLNEINAVPGSLAYYLFCRKISEFTELLTGLVRDAEKKQRETDNRVSSFQSQVLSGNWQSIKK